MFEFVAFLGGFICGLLVGLFALAALIYWAIGSDNDNNAT